MICERCQVQTHIIDDPANGCYVCTECGLVTSDQYMEDDAWFDKGSERISHEECTPFQIPTHKPKSVSNKMFFSMQDPHQIKLVHFNKRFNAIAEHFPDFPDVILNEAKCMYLSLEKNTSLKGRNLDYIICAFIYLSAQRNNRALELNIFGKEYVNEILKSVQFVQEKLNITSMVLDPDSGVYQDKEIESYIFQFCNGFPELNRRIRCDILKLIPKTQYIMRKKSAIAAGLIVYHLSDMSLIKTLSSRHCLSDTTIRAVIKDLKK